MTTSQIIPAYPYVQFSDDVNISAWFSAYNQYAQNYLDWFNETPLAVYTNESISAPLLDWVANGVYGVYRVPIAFYQESSYGEINTYGLNQIPLNQKKIKDSSTVQTMSDDVFRRLITWDFYKGDGAQFTIPWIKKRVARFLFGIDGFSDTNSISVTFPSAMVVKIFVTIYSTEFYLAQQLAALLAAGIPNFPEGYTATLTFIDAEIKNDDFGGDIA